jgi:hypothetical protein
MFNISAVVHDVISSVVFAWWERPNVFQIMNVTQRLIATHHAQLRKEQHK